MQRSECSTTHVLPMNPELERRMLARRVAWTTALLGAALSFAASSQAGAQSSSKAWASSGARVMSESAVAVSSGKHIGRGGRHGSRSVRVVRYRPHRSAYFGLGYPWWGWGPYYGWGWGTPYYGRAVDYYGDDWGAIDLDIKPEEAEVYLDGERIGIADNYDGFPRYLWLEKGTYHLVLYKEGYETLAKRIELSEGGVLRLKDKMVPGEAKSPEELFAQVQPKDRAEDRTSARSADERPLAPWRYRDRDRDGAERAESARSQRSGRSGQDWRNRRSSTSEPAATDLRSAGGRLELVVTPPDAAVYVDGKFVGTAADLAQGEGVRLDAGTHKVQLSRPGYAGVEREFTVKEGEATRLEIQLEQ